MRLEDEREMLLCVIPDLVDWDQVCSLILLYCKRMQLNPTHQTISVMGGDFALKMNIFRNTNTGKFELGAGWPAGHTMISGLDS